MSFHVTPTHPHAQTLVSLGKQVVCAAMTQKWAPNNTNDQLDLSKHRDKFTLSCKSLKGKIRMNHKFVYVWGRAGWTEPVSVTPFQLCPLPLNQVGKSQRGPWKEEEKKHWVWAWSILAGDPDLITIRFLLVSNNALIPKQCSTNEN